MITDEIMDKLLKIIKKCNIKPKRLLEVHFFLSS